MIQGLFETHIQVANLEKSAEFYENVLGLQLGYTDEKRRVRFYWIGAPNRAMLGLWERDPAEIQRLHFAFQVALDDMAPAVSTVKQHGVRVRDFFGKETEEPSVFGWMPAASLYFADPDGHSLEFIAPLNDPPRPDVGVVSLTEWEAIHARVR